jgi:hypothetical protein
MAFGLWCVKNGVWDYGTFSGRFGWPTVAFAADWIALGAISFLLGALPWANWLERRNRRR